MITQANAKKTVNSPSFEFLTSPENAKAAKLALGFPRTGVHAMDICGYTLFVSSGEAADFKFPLYPPPRPYLVVTDVSPESTLPELIALVTSIINPACVTYIALDHPRLTNDDQQIRLNIGISTLEITGDIGALVLSSTSLVRLLEDIGLASYVCLHKDLAYNAPSPQSQANATRGIPYMPEHDESRTDSPASSVSSGSYAAAVVKLPSALNFRPEKGKNAVVPTNYFTHEDHAVHSGYVIEQVKLLIESSVATSMRAAMAEAEERAQQQAIISTRMIDDSVNACEIRTRDMVKAIEDRQAVANEAAARATTDTLISMQTRQDTIEDALRRSISESSSGVERKFELAMSKMDTLL